MRTVLLALSVTVILAAVGCNETPVRPIPPKTTVQEDTESKEELSPKAKALLARVKEQERRLASAEADTHLMQRLGLACARPGQVYKYLPQAISGGDLKGSCAALACCNFDRQSLFELRLAAIEQIKATLPLRFDADRQRDCLCQSSCQSEQSLRLAGLQF